MSAYSLLCFHKLWVAVFFDVIFFISHPSNGFVVLQACQGLIHLYLRCFNVFFFMMSKRKSNILNTFILHWMVIICLEVIILKSTMFQIPFYCLSSEDKVPVEFSFKHTCVYYLSILIFHRFFHIRFSSCKFCLKKYATNQNK